MEAYNLGIIGILALCLLSVLLAVYSGSSKGRAGALSGPIVPADDDNLLYRIDRVHMNSVEALAPFVVPAMLAMLVGVEPTTLAALVWLHPRYPAGSPGDLPSRRRRGQRWQRQDGPLRLGSPCHLSSCHRDRLGRHALRRLMRRTPACHG